MTGNRGSKHASPSPHSRFLDLVAELDMSGVGLAERVGVTPSTASTWRTGKVEPPGAVLAYLELLVEIRRLGK